jgi:predicted Zn-dependent peptidase
MKKCKLFLILTFVLLSLSSAFAQKAYKYETVPNDPLNARIYTLDNGLKVYLTVYKDEPRIQCYIPVKVGSKNDPKETTGLAHYFEHMMFKGTPDFGTTNWEKEKPMIDEIEKLFEIYRMETVKGKRDSIYHIIDSISYQASKLAIPNEYVKMMKAIGSEGTNAATSNDYTVYIENIPSNQLENWAIVQADRFLQPVLRLFHTELETIYEEKNMSLTNDGRKSSEAMLQGLFPNNPYGQQTTLGSQEHLRNPSMKNIRDFHSKYYVANNMAVCLSGDFDFDEAIAIIDKYFSVLPNRPVPAMTIIPETPITQPVVKEVVGLEAENVQIAFRIGEPANSKEMYLLRMFDNILANGKAGLIDLNLNQKQAVYSASGYPYILCDNSAYVLYGKPKTGQTLDEVRDLLLAQVELVKQGKFEDRLIGAAINNLKLSEMRQLESNSSRGRMMANAFQNNIPWAEEAHSIDFYSKVTKQDVIDFANKYFKNNYVIIYKRQGQPEDVVKVTKPAITPIEVNREAESEFFQKFKANQPASIKPVFVDFDKEITFCNLKNIKVYYIQNKENKTFNLTFRFKAGEMNDLKLPIALDYFDYLGTNKYTAEQIKEKYYQLACNLSANSSDDNSEISLSGLSDNFEEALVLTIHLLENAQPNEDALKNMVADLLKSRTDAKSNQNAVLNALISYCEYGSELTRYMLSEEQLKSLTGDELIGIVKQLLSYEPEILYYGPETKSDFLKSISKIYKAPKKFAEPQPEKIFKMLPVTEDKVYFAPYDAKQARLVSYSRSEKFNSLLYPVINMYNQYFGGSMNAIVFQEMREKRSLAYSAQSRFVIPSEADDYMYNYSFIATQNDKIVDAIMAFNELFNQMPQAEKAFNLAKEAVKSSIETNRITKFSIINTYIRNRELGYNYDYRRDIYNAVDKFTLDDVINFNRKYIKDKYKTYMILSKESEVNFPLIEEKISKVNRLTLEDIFGY